MKPKTLKVKAGENGIVLTRRSRKVHGKWTYAITSSPVDVPNTRFFNRRILKGDLILVSDAPASPAPDGNKPKKTRKREND